jgi:hypothetical protein
MSLLLCVDQLLVYIFHLPVNLFAATAVVIVTMKAKMVGRATWQIKNFMK